MVNAMLTVAASPVIPSLNRKTCKHKRRCYPLHR